jgi:hypothetical protein
MELDLEGVLADFSLISELALEYRDLLLELFVLLLQVSPLDEEALLVDHENAHLTENAFDGVALAFGFHLLYVIHVPLESVLVLEESITLYL